MLYKCSVTLCIIVCLLSHSNQSNSSRVVVSLCENSGLYSCSCEESAYGRALYLLSVVCSFQNINLISDDMVIPNNTETLDFSVNEITDVSYVKLFDNFNIQILRLNRNKIKNIAGGSFVDLSNLSELDLSENILENLDPKAFHGIYKLKKLYLYSNKFTVLEHNIFSGLPVLEVLSLSGNNLGAFLSNSSDIFTSQSIAINPKIQSLYLDNINMSNIPLHFFDNAYNMRELFLRNNPISKFPNLPFTLEALDLSGTRLTALEQDNFVLLPAIKYLYLNDLENLQTIEKFAFLPMQGLNTIELQNCKKYQNMDKDTFGIFEEGEDLHFPILHINMMGSGLKTLDETLLPFFSKLSNLDLRANPWVCDCKLKWILNLQLSAELKDDIRCDRPPNLKGKKLFSLRPNELECKTWNRVVSNITRIVLVVLCITLGGLAVWLVVLWPPQDRHRPSTGPVGPDSPYSRITTTHPSGPAIELTTS